MREDGPIFTLGNVVIFDVNMKVGHRPKNICNISTTFQLEVLRRKICEENCQTPMMTDHDRWSLQLKGATIKKRQQSLMILILYQKIFLAFPSPNSNTVQSIPLKSSPRAPIILVFFIFPIMRQVCQCYPSTNLFSMEDCHFAH